MQGAGAKTNTTLDKGFKGLKKTVKRFALGMLSVRSVISLISKAMRSYLSTNDERIKKYQIFWDNFSTSDGKISSII